MKRDRWTIDEIKSLPVGEDGRFDRKEYPSNHGDLPALLGKHLSAFANTGGGHILLGVADDGRITGCPRDGKGRQKTKDWVNRVVSDTLDPALIDFLIHEVESEPADSSQPSLLVLVIDIGDSPGAPHQCRLPLNYFYRVGCDSRPAPHFHLDMLRRRPATPNLGVREEQAYAFGLEHTTLSGLVLHGAIRSRVQNKGRVVVRAVMAQWNQWEIEYTEWDWFRIPPDDQHPSTAHLSACAERLLPLAQADIYSPFCICVEPSIKPQAEQLQWAKKVVDVTRLRRVLVSEVHVGESAEMPLGRLISPTGLCKAVETLGADEFDMDVRGGAQHDFEHSAGHGIRIGQLRFTTTGSQILMSVKNTSPYDFRIVDLNLCLIEDEAWYIRSIGCGRIHDFRRGEERHHSHSWSKLPTGNKYRVSITAAVDPSRR